MGSDLYLHNRWLHSGWSEYQIRAISDHPESNETIRAIFAHEYFAKSSSADLSVLKPDDLLVFARLGSRITTFYDADSPEGQAEFERLMGYVADWLASEPSRQLSVRIADGDGIALGVDGTGSGSFVCSMEELRELDGIGLQGEIEPDDPLSRKSWLLMGPGPCLFSPYRTERSKLAKEHGLELHMVDFIAGDPWGLEHRLLQLFSQYSQAESSSLSECLRESEAQSSAPPLLRDLAELALNAVASHSCLVLDYA